MLKKDHYFQTEEGGQNETAMHRFKEDQRTLVSMRQKNEQEICTHLMHIDNHYIRLSMNGCILVDGVHFLPVISFRATASSHIFKNI